MGLVGRDPQAREPIEQPASDRWRDERLPRGDDPDRPHEVRRWHVLEEESAGAGAQRFDDVLIGIEGGEDEDAGARRVAGGADQGAGRGHPVHDGHADVHHDHVGPEGGGRLDGLLPVRRLAHDLDPILVGQDHPEAGADELLVVDEEHADGHVALTGSVPSIGSRAVMRKPARGRPGRQASAEHRDPLAHPDETATLVGRLDRCGAARTAVVLDLDVERPHQVADRDPGSSTTGVLQRVGQALLDDPIRRELEPRIQRPPRALDRQLDGEARTPNLFDQRVQPIEPGKRLSARRPRRGSRACDACRSAPGERWRRSPRARRAPPPAASPTPASRRRPG